MNLNIQVMKYFNFVLAGSIFLLTAETDLHASQNAQITREGIAKLTKKGIFEANLNET